MTLTAPYHLTFMIWGIFYIFEMGEARHFKVCIQIGVSSTSVCMIVYPKSWFVLKVI